MEKINKLTVNGQSYILSDAETAEGLTQETAARQTGDETTLQEAKNYTDTAANTLLSNLNKGDTVTLQKAKSYTEEKCAQLETQVAGVGEQIVTESASRAEADAWLQAQINNLTPGEERAMELINAIEVTDGETADIIFDNFCLKKFFLRVKFPGNENTASATVTMGFLEKRDNGSFHSFSTFTQSLLQPNTTRYASFWGTAFVGNPFEFYYIPAGSLADLNAPIYGRPYPETVEKGLTRINVYGIGKLFPIGTKAELWGVRV